MANALLTNATESTHAPNRWNATQTGDIRLNGANIYSDGGAFLGGNPANPRNVAHCGDFQTNPWQRGSSITGIANTVTYAADRWFGVGGASSSITITKTANTGIAGFTQALAFGRASANTDTTAITLGQIVESYDAYKLQGLPVCLSFWAATGANYSGGALSVSLVSGTSADEGAATAISGFTGAANVISTTQTITGTMTRYQFTGTVPAGCKELAILLAYTPTGTAGSADNILFHGVQLEVGPSASPFEFHTPQFDLDVAQRFYSQINEISGAVFGNGMMSATNVQTVCIPLPQNMRAAPTVGVTAGGFKFNIAGTLTAVGAGFAAGATQSLGAISVVGAVTATVAQGTQLVGSNTTGKITASADL